MKNLKVFFALVGFVLCGSSNLVFAHGVTNAKALELAFHRVERLVLLCNLGDAALPHNIPGMPGYDPSKCKNDPSKPKKGIDPDFQNKLQTITMALLPHNEEDEPSFRATVYQHKAADGTQQNVEIIMDEEGRPLSYTVGTGGPAANAPTWTDKDPTTISENALHYVLEGSVTDPLLRSYNEGLARLTINLGTNSAGQAVAVVDMERTEAEPILRIRMRVDGNFDSAEYITRTP